MPLRGKVWSGANGELYEMFAYMSRSPQEWGAFTGTAMLGGVRALTQYVVLIFVSATSMSTANTFTQNLNIIISIFSQRGTMHEVAVTPTLVAGVSLVCVFSVAYTLLKADRRLLAWVDENMPLCSEGVLCARAGDAAFRVMGGGWDGGKEEEGPTWKVHDASGEGIKPTLAEEGALLPVMEGMDKPAASAAAAAGR